MRPHCLHTYLKLVPVHTLFIAVSFHRRECSRRMKFSRLLRNNNNGVYVCVLFCPVAKSPDTLHFCLFRKGICMRDESYKCPIVRRKLSEDAWGPRLSFEGYTIIGFHCLFLYFSDRLSFVGCRGTIGGLLSEKNCCEYARRNIKVVSKYIKKYFYNESPIKRNMYNDQNNYLFIDFLICTN